MFPNFPAYHNGTSSWTRVQSYQNFSTTRPLIYHNRPHLRLTAYHIHLVRDLSAMHSNTRPTHFDPIYLLSRISQILTSNYPFYPYFLPSMITSYLSRALTSSTFASLTQSLHLPSAIRIDALTNCCISKLCFNFSNSISLANFDPCHFNIQCRLYCKSRVHFGVKVIYIHFLDETYMLFKKKDVSNFFLPNWTS